ncbi:MAG TPA: hypothetical protein VKD26_04870 [Streptosporangiaceae bacterium]|nr:hypothetical protein [Streptosporangiaceae bacterium]
MATSIRSHPGPRRTVIANTPPGVPCTAHDASSEAISSISPTRGQQSRVTARR